MASSAGNLYAIIHLGIVHVGEETALALASEFGDFSSLRKAKIEKLKNIPDVGPIVAESIYEWFNDDYNREFLTRLLKYVCIEPYVAQYPEM
ncbi:helix-hairpin-helix domain-containing protein [Patescibacteria group bacterium]